MKKQGKKEGKKSGDGPSLADSACKLINAASSAACNIIEKVIDGTKYRCCELHCDRRPA